MGGVHTVCPGCDNPTAHLDILVVPADLSGSLSPPPTPDSFTCPQHKGLSLVLDFSILAFDDVTVCGSL